MKKIEWDNPNKMHFESPHKTFNRQAVCITTGNCVAPTQYSGYIRPYTETMCGTLSYAPGHLQQFDLKSFHYYSIHPNILDTVRRLTHERTGILYVFKHSNGSSEGHRIIDGVVLTTGHDEGCRHIHTWYLNNDWRAQAAVDEATKYICDDYDEEGELRIPSHTIEV